MRPIDVWVVPLEPSAGDEALLDERERARLERLRVADKKEQFLAAQAALRRLLGARIGREPADIAFAYGPHGKPALPDHPELAFNLSHSERLAVVGITEHTELGVDLEWTGRDRPFLRLARRYFDASEHAWLEGRDEETVRAGFYRTWTLKEAFLKALGTGLAVPPASFRIDLETDPPRLLSTHDGSDPSRWRLVTPAVEPGFAAAVCWQGEPREIRVRPGAGGAAPA